RQQRKRRTLLSHRFGCDCIGKLYADDYGHRGKYTSNQHRRNGSGNHQNYDATTTSNWGNHCEIDNQRSRYFFRQRKSDFGKFRSDLSGFSQSESGYEENGGICLVVRQAHYDDVKQLLFFIHLFHYENHHIRSFKRKCAPYFTRNGKIENYSVWKKEKRKFFTQNDK